MAGQKSVHSCIKLLVYGWFNAGDAGNIATWLL